MSCWGLIFIHRWDLHFVFKDFSVLMPVASFTGSRLYISGLLIFDHEFGEE